MQGHAPNTNVQLITYNLIKGQKVRRPFVGLHKYALVVWVSGGSTSPCCYALCLMHLGLNEGRLEEWVFLFIYNIRDLHQIDQKLCVPFGYVFPSQLTRSPRRCRSWRSLCSRLRNGDMVIWNTKEVEPVWLIYSHSIPTDLFKAEAPCVVWWCLSSMVFGFVWPVEMTASCVALNMRRARPLRQRLVVCCILPSL